MLKKFFSTLLMNCEIYYLILIFRVVVFVFVYSIGDITGGISSPFATVKWDDNTR